MASRMETVLLALVAALSGVPGTVKRNMGLAESIPLVTGGGLVVIHDGEPGEPEFTMSPLTYHYEHSVDVDIFVQGGHDLDARFDALKVSVGTRLLADRTLGGLVDWVEPMAPKPGNLSELGMASIKAATIEVVLSYASPSPLL
jgi:hypothetical protein